MAASTTKLSSDTRDEERFPRGEENKRRRKLQTISAESIDIHTLHKLKIFTALQRVDSSLELYVGQFHGLNCSPLHIKFRSQHFQVFYESKKRLEMFHGVSYWMYFDITCEVICEQLTRLDSHLLYEQSRKTAWKRHAGTPWVQDMLHWPRTK